MQWSKPPRRVLYLYNRESSAARKHNAESHSLRADLEWKLGVSRHPADAATAAALAWLLQSLSLWHAERGSSPTLMLFRSVMKQIAREFKDEPALYFPHNLDFRGRAYPMHGNLNHLGSDVSRGMLQFAEARPLGERGLYWLHVQVSSRASSSDAEGGLITMLEPVCLALHRPGLLCPNSGKLRRTLLEAHQLLVVSLVAQAKI